MSWEIRQGDALDRLREMPDESVQCVVTSPPYWGLRDYGTPGQLGLEPTPEAYVAKMVEVFREVRRVLRRDGTLWLNLGDSYASGGRGGGMEGERGEKQRSNEGALLGPKKAPPGLKPKDLVGIPWRVAFALQADGWWLRSDIIWSKPNPMPESVTDRPTKAHEYLFLLTKSARYYFDAEAVREAPDKWYGDKPEDYEGKSYNWTKEVGGIRTKDKWSNPAGRNIRSVWTIATQPFPQAHFATFPEKLVEPCVKAGTSEKGCCATCGAGWVRVTERYADRREPRDGSNTKANLSGPAGAERRLGPNGWNLPSSATKTTGWAPGCDCAAKCSCGHTAHDRYSDHDECHECECDSYETSGGPIPPVPCLVLDPFAGSGTVGVVALRLGRSFVGIELKPEYAEMARRRITDDAPLLNTAE